MSNYDQWKLASPPETGYSPLICTECREHVFEDCEDLFEQPHCFDEDTAEPIGKLVTDWSYDWRDDNPRIP